MIEPFPLTSRDQKLGVDTAERLGVGVFDEGAGGEIIRHGQAILEVADGTK